MKMENDGRIPAFEDEHAFESMRDNSFDLYGAIGELIDNSIQAEAKKVNILVEDVPSDNKRVKYRIISKIACGDDGYGMEGSQGGVLQNSVRFGYSTRYNDRKGIGRYGVGMTQAGIKFATCVEVYSKKTGSGWNYIQFDLKNPDDIHYGIAPPIQKEPPKEYLSLMGKDQGTLVIWSKFDKINDQDLHSNTHQDDLGPELSLDPYGILNHFIGRTYRKSIWNGIKFTVNGKEVFSFDPLYLNKQNNQFPDDDPALKVFEDDIEWPIDPQLDTNEFANRKSKAHIIITYLPRQYRKIQNRGGNDFKGRYIDENEGISILRYDREVFYDHIPYLQENKNRKIAWEFKDRWWGCEISYNPELDASAFSINSIKRKIEPTKDFKITLYRIISEFRKRCIEEEVPNYWNEVKSEENKNEASKHPDIPQTHALVEKIAISVKIPEKKKDLPIVSDEEEARRMAALTSHLSEIEGAQWRAKFKSQPFIVVERSWPGNTFIQITYTQGSSVLEYNTRHLFFEELCNLRENIQKLEDKSLATQYAKKTYELIDVLLMAFVQSRRNWTHNDEYSVNDSMERLVSDWGFNLESYTKAYQKERLYEEDI